MSLARDIMIAKAFGGGGGSGGGVLVVNVAVTGDFDTGFIFTFDKTAGEVWQAGAAIVSYEFPEGEFKKQPLKMIYTPNDPEEQYVFRDNDGDDFSAATAEDYPVYYM